MARTTKVIIKDDFTGEEIHGDARTVELTLDGMTYELDLGKDSHQELLDRLDPFIRDVTPVKAKVTRQQRIARSTPGTTPATVDREQSRAMRKWWRAAYDAGVRLPNGSHLPTPSDRGRIPDSVVNLYHNLGGQVPSHGTNGHGEKPPAEAADAGAPKVRFSSGQQEDSQTD